MIVLGDLDDEGRARLEAAKARYRAFEARLGVGCGQVFMMAVSTEEQRAAWRARSDRRNFRKKNSLGRIVLEDVPHDPLIKMMLGSGFYARPRTGPPTFKGAKRALDVMVRHMMAMGLSRVTMEKLLLDSSGEKVVTTHEAKENVERNAKD